MRTRAARPRARPLGPLADVPLSAFPPLLSATCNRTPTGLQLYCLAESCGRSSAMPSRKGKGGGDGDQTKELAKERTRLGSSWAPAAQPTEPPSTKVVTFKCDDSTAPGVPSPTSIDADLTDAPRSPRGRGTDMRAAEYMKERVIKGRIVAQASK